MGKAHDFIRSGKLPISEWHSMVQLIFKQMVEALEFMHCHRVAHFDISLENMLISEVEVTIDSEDQLHFILKDVEIKICDFGLVDIFESKIRTPNGISTSFISTKKCGKTLYKSPEMLCGVKVDAAKNDVWCLGVTLFMMLIGGSPFSSATRGDDTFRRVMNGEMLEFLKDWKRDHYVTNEMVLIMQSMLQYEDRRISLYDLKKYPFLN